MHPLSSYRRKTLVLNYMLQNNTYMNIFEVILLFGNKIFVMYQFF